MRFLKSKYKGIVLIILMIMTLSLITIPNAWGQVPNTSSLNNFFSPGDDSAFVQETVRLDGQELFQISAPRVSNDDQGNPAIHRRIKKIQNRLSFIVNSQFDLNSLEVFYQVKNNLPVIYASWKGREKPYEIMTVTSLDAEIDGVDPEGHAMELIPIIKEGIIQAKSERQPELLKRQFAIAFFILLVTSITTTLVSYRQKQLKKQWEILSEKILPHPLKHDKNKGVTDVESAQKNPEYIKIKKQINWNTFQRQSLQILQILIIYIACFIVLGLFPQTRFYQLILNAINILLIITIFIYLSNRLTLLFIDRFMTALEDSSFLIVNPDVSRRKSLRAYTLAQTLKSIAIAVWLIIWVITILAVLKVNSASILAAGGLISLALSIMFNDLIKDIIAGIFILIDDQFAVGDVIAIGQLTGKVENMNLRMTQLRNTNGNLITVPNRIITSVENLSNGWSQVDLTLNVDYHTDVDQAIQVINEVAQTMKEDPNWSVYILEPPTVLGVDELNHTGIGIRIFIKTQPLQQWPVAREYRRRLKIAFDQHKISIGIPQQNIQLTGNRG